MKLMPRVQHVATLVQNCERNYLEVIFANAKEAVFSLASSLTDR